MAKTFITERDVDDMKARGVTSIDVSDNVVMTDLAVERAMKQGIKINRVEQGPAPKATYSPSVNLVAAFPREAPRGGSVGPADAEIIARVKAAVLARLDGQVDPLLLEAVITRVVAAMK